MARNSAVQRAIDSIADDVWVPVKYPGSVRDPDTGAWISDAEVAETVYTAYASTSHPVTARLIVRRVKDAAILDSLFPVWRHHPFFTNTTLPTTTADVTHRAHAIVETVFADLIDGPLAHMPSGSFAANSAWILCAAIAHNLLRAAGVLAGGLHAKARGATLRRKIINVPARLTRPQRKPTLHLPTHWPWSKAWLHLWHSIIGSSRPTTPDTDHPAASGSSRTQPWKSWVDQRPPPAHTRSHREVPDSNATAPQTDVSRWIEVKCSARCHRMSQVGSNSSCRDRRPLRTGAMESAYEMLLVRGVSV